MFANVVIVAALIHTGIRETNTLRTGSGVGKGSYVENKQNTIQQKTCPEKPNDIAISKTIDCLLMPSLPETQYFKGLCMSCFNCNSKSNPKCNDPLDEAWVVFLECNQKDFKKLLDSSSIVFPKVKTAFQAYPDLDESKATCQKLVVKNGEENVVFRTCSMSDIQGMNTCDKHRQILGNDSVVFCEQCNSRLCNASDVTSTNLLLLLISAFTTLIKTYL